MGTERLGIPEVRAMIAHVARRMIESTAQLTQADRAIGDGDHGVGMARGFENVLRKIEGQEFSTLGELFLATGMAIMTATGGAAGAIFGTLFQGAARGLKAEPVLTAEVLSRILLDGLRAVKERGKAKPGDKTMIDALEPAALESVRRTSANLDEALLAITEASRLGMEKTKDMVAAVGKAKTLGPRSLGHPDPGAVSMFLILSFMADYVRGISDEPPGLPS